MDVPPVSSSAPTFGCQSYPNCVERQFIVSKVAAQTQNLFRLEALGEGKTASVVGFSVIKNSNSKTGVPIDE